jgi:hypothetical protein
MAERANLGRQIQREVTRIDGQAESDRIKRFNDEIARDKATIASKEEGSKERVKLQAALFVKLRESELKELYQSKEDEKIINEKYDEFERLADAEQKEFLRLQKKEYEDTVIATEISRSEAELEFLRFKGQETLDLELELLEQKREQAVREAGLTEDQIKQINEAAHNDVIMLNAKTAAAKKDIAKNLFQSQLKMAADAFGVSKELALAEMLIAAPKSIGEVWAQAAKQPTIPQVIAHGVVGTASVVGPIYKTIKDIKKAKMSKGGKASGATSQSSGSSGVGSSNIDSLAANNVSRLGGDSSLISNASSDAVNSTQTTGTNGLIIFSESSYQDFQDQITFRNNTTSI